MTNTISLGGVPNFRDCGGLPAAGGRRVMAGRLLRSEAFATLGDDDNAVLTALEHLCVCDLRSSGERSEQVSPYMLHERMELLTAADSHEAGAVNLVQTFQRMIDSPPEEMVAYMHHTYRKFALQFADTLRELFERMLKADAPVLVHCAAGKDRTGFVCAVIQHAIGVPEAAIRADYLLSDQHFGAPRLAELLHRRSGRHAPSPIVDALRVRADYLDDAFTTLVEQYGSVDEYLTALGLTPSRRLALQARMTVAV